VNIHADSTQRILDSLRYVSDMLSFLLGSSLLFIGTAHLAVPVTKAPPTVRQEKTATQLASEGIAAYEKKDYALAAKLLQLAVERDSDQSDLLYYIYRQAFFRPLDCSNARDAQIGERAASESCGRSFAKRWMARIRLTGCTARAEERIARWIWATGWVSRSRGVLQSCR
jgi:hypothetical protein